MTLCAASKVQSRERTFDESTVYGDHGQGITRRLPSCAATYI